MKLLLFFLITSLVLGLRAGKRNEDVRVLHLLILSAVVGLGFLSLRMI
jgi:hypothetical protein